MFARAGGRSVVRSVLAVLALGCVSAAEAAPLDRDVFPFTISVESAKTPQGWLDFCRKNPGDCKAGAVITKLRYRVEIDAAADDVSLFGFDLPSPAAQAKEDTTVFGALSIAAIDQTRDAKPSRAGPPEPVVLTDTRLEEIERINRTVNTAIKPMTDMKHHKVADRWDYPSDGYGDCEDYALMKRLLLMQAGWPVHSLLMTVVWAGREGHAVLLVRTDKGDFVLDNQSPKVSLWWKTRYDFVKRQSPIDPSVWVYIDGDKKVPTAVAQRGGNTL